MRTLLVAPVLYSLHGGIPRILRLYERALGELNGPTDALDVLVLNDAPASVTERETRSGEFRACARNKLKFAWHLFRLGWGAQRLVCGHVHLAPLVWLLQVFRPGLRVFHVGHGIDIWRRLSWAERRGVRAAERLICVSEFSRRELLRHNPALPAERTVVVPNAIELGAWSAVPRDHAPPRASRLEGQSGQQAPLAVASQRSQFTVLTVARLTSADREKGVETVIAAMPLVWEQFPGAVLRVVGTGDDRVRLKAAAEATAASHGRGPLAPQSGILFLGAIDDEALRREYAGCDVFVLPSRKEGFGLVYLEAMAFGKPCVAAAAGGAPEVVNAEVGRLVPYGEPAAVGTAIGEMLRNPPDAARVRAQAERFSYDAFRARLRGVLGSEAGN